LSHSTPPPHGNDAEIANVLRGARRNLRTAELALDNFPSTPDRERAIAAMHSVVVFGRSVTNILQHLRSKVPDFDTWYEPWRVEMEQDPLMRYLYKLRSDLLKKVREGATNVVRIQHASTGELLHMLGPPPPNAVGSFVGDVNGGSGWEVQLEDGSIEKMYVTLPENDNVRAYLAFEEPPSEHLGAPIADDSLEYICQLYVQYLRRLLEEAEEHFGSPN
jgi:hypothetical protein